MGNDGWHSDNDGGPVFRGAVGCWIVLALLLVFFGRVLLSALSLDH